VKKDGVLSGIKAFYIKNDLIIPGHTISLIEIWFKFQGNCR
jgi:hypothetical protein